MNTMVTVRRPVSKRGNRRPVSKRGNRREMSSERLTALVNAADQAAERGTERMEKVRQSNSVRG